MNKSYKILCSKLLDTGKRNKLINFSHTMRSIEILYPSIDNVFEMLNNGRINYYFIVKII